MKKLGKSTTKASKAVYKWDNRYYYRCYGFAREGLTNGQIAAILSVTPNWFAGQIKKRPSLKDALKEGRKERKDMKNGLSGYIFDRLTPEARQVWDRLKTTWESADEQSRERKLRDVLDGSSEATTKALFLHAVAFTNFDPSTAMKMVGISKRQVKKWADDDREFLEALDEIEEHKKNWYESKLTGLVAANHDGAILFVNRTYNADRGYSPKQTMNVTSTVNHVHSGQVTLETLSPYLDLPTLEKLHAAVRALQMAGPAENKALPAHKPDIQDDVIDAEILSEAGQDE